MDKRKRQLDEAHDDLKTPEKRVSVVRRLQDSDYMHWGVDETCQYLRREGLREWEDAFRG